MRIGILPNSRYFYPDASVVCGRPAFADEKRDVLLNPTVVIEVLSDATITLDDDVAALVGCGTRTW